MKAKIEKSRFGTQGRVCAFKIMWGGDAAEIRDEESWLEAIKGSEYISNAGAWFSLHYEDDSEDKFQKATWLDRLQEEKFRSRVIELMDREIVQKFDDRTGHADDFYKIDEEKENE